MEQTVSTQSDVNLDASLAAYGRRARRSQRSKTEMLGYTAAAGGLAFAGGDAMGAIVHNTTGASGSIDYGAGTIAGGALKVLTIDIDGTGGIDWALYFGFLGEYPVAINRGVDVVAKASVFFGDSLNYASNLSPGFVVGPDLASGKTFVNFTTNASFLESPFLFVTGSNESGPFAFGITDTGYIGLRFNGDTGTVGAQYAWAKVQVESSDTNVSVSILEWAYDNSGCPIQVGATTGGGSCGGSENNNSVDSPSTPLLSLLGLGAMGVTSYRRRREAGLKRLAEAQGDVAA